jgi:hypothetical protein
VRGVRGTHRDPRDRFKKKPKDADGRGRDRREMRDQSARPIAATVRHARESSGKAAVDEGPPRDRESFTKRPWDPKAAAYRDASGKRPLDTQGTAARSRRLGKPPWTPKGPRAIASHLPSVPGTRKAAA